MAIILDIQGERYYYRFMALTIEQFCDYLIKTKKEGGLQRAFTKNITRETFSNARTALEMATSIKRA